MELNPAASRTSAAGPADWFTGQVWMDELGALPSAGIRTLRVTFSPGARTAWHAHPGGQVLHVMDGAGLVQAAGGPVRPLRPGDTVVAAPGERHWHGAAPDQLMSHVAISVSDPATGQQTVWAEQVSDEAYLAGPEPA
jgi:quercetin dioxygenase-like cupin family protein